MSFNGVYIGVVVGAMDPQGKGRVMVQVPGVGPATGWAPVCQPFGSKGGAAATGATVVVAFEQGDPQRPIVLGRLA